MVFWMAGLMHRASWQGRLAHSSNTQRAQYCLVKEYALNHIGNLNLI